MEYDADLLYERMILRAGLHASNREDGYTRPTNIIAIAGADPYAERLIGRFVATIWITFLSSVKGICVRS